ncbi:MAG TPA: hypothetical protein VF929_09905 [Gemmatimonadaceae bacterium]
MSVNLAPDSALEHLLTTSLAAADALSTAAHEVLQLPAGVALNARGLAREWLATLGPNVFANVPQAAINYANRIILAAHAANGVHEAGLRALLASVMSTLDAQCDAVAQIETAIDAFRAAVARDAAADSSEAAGRFSKAAGRLAAAIGAVVQSWRRIAEAMHAAIDDAGAADLMEAMAAWEITRAGATVLQQSSLRG